MNYLYRYTILLGSIRKRCLQLYSFPLVELDLVYGTVLSTLSERYS